MDNLEEDEKNASFIRERIVKKRLNKKEWLLHWAARILGAVLLAVIFGAVSGAVFAKVSSISEREAVPIEKETLSIPRDIETTTEETTQAVIETEPESTEPETTHEQFENAVQSVIDEANLNLGIDDFSKLYTELSAKFNAANKSVVTILSKEEHKDWFDNSIENGVLCSGIIWNITDAEILIATIYDFTDRPADIEIGFSDGSYADGYIKGFDKELKLTVIAVPKELVTIRTNSLISAVNLGNSYTASQGEAVFIVGNPSGSIGSLLYGNISYGIDNMLVADMSQRGFALTNTTYSGGNGFIIDFSGNMIGLYGKEFSGEYTRAYGISDLKGVLEKLSNGSSIAYLGIKGYTVTDTLAERYGLVKGVLIEDTVVDEAAYMAGIKSGDIISSIDGANVTSLHSLQNTLETYNPGDVINVSVMRNGADEYTELAFEIVLGSR